MVVIIIMVITVSVSTWQVIVTISTSNTNNKRDIHKETIYKCEYFQSKIIPQYIELIKFHDKNKIDIIGKVHFDKSTGILTKPYKLSSKYPDFLEKTMFLFNEMDAFSAFIIDNKIADLNLAYKIQGKAFCDIIEKLEVIYNLYLTTNKDDYYSLEKLYNLWAVKHSKRNILVEY